MLLHSRGVRMVALLEAAKGALILTVGVGALSLIHHDFQSYAEEFVRTFHLNPASKYPRIFLDAAGRIGDAQVWLLAAAAAGYAAVRFIEAYGLWRVRRWAEWFAVVSGGIYLPIEIYELARGVSWAKLAIFFVNLVIVAYMSYVLWESQRKTAPGPGTGPTDSRGLP
jgi:uncharacterized membrane protein (DUF2068 family)